MFTLIGAMSKNNCVGVNNNLPWKIPSDLKFFKAATLNKKIVMGYNTFLSLNKKPLPKRDNIVIIRESDVDKIENTDGFRFLTFDQIIEEEYSKSGEYFIIGGPKTWELFKDYYSSAFVTIVDADISGDAYVNDNLFEVFGYKDTFSIEQIYSGNEELDLSKDEFSYKIDVYAS